MPAPWFVDTSNVAAAGWLAGLDRNRPAAAPRFVRDDVQPRDLYLAVPSTNSPGRFDEIDPSTISSVRVGFGQVDEAPTSGTWALTVNGTATGMSAMSYAITAAALEALIDAVVPVSVTLDNGLYTITVVATNTSITLASPSNTLGPASTVVIDNPTVAAVGVQAVYTIRLLQSPWAYSTNFTARATSVSPGTISSVSSGGDTITVSASVTAGVAITFGTTGTLPGGLTADTIYYPLTTGTTVQLARTPGGSVVDITAVAGSGTHTVYTSRDAVTIEQIAPGSSTSQARYSVAISPDPIGGALRLLWGQKQTVVVSCQANTTSLQVWTLTGRSNAGNQLHGLYFDIPDDSDVTCRVWFDNNAAGLAGPATPSGGRRLKVNTILTDESLAVVVAKIADALITDGDFTCSIDEDYLLTITAAVAGLKTATTSGGTSGFAVAVLTAGSSGQLAGQGFILDLPGGLTLGIYGTVGGLPTAVPAFAAACTYQQAVALTSGDTGTDVAADLATAIDALADFTATSSGNLLTVVAAANGALAETSGSTAVSSTSYFSVALTQSGASFVATWDASADDATVAAAGGTTTVGDFFAVTKTANHAWTLTRLVVGAPEPPTVENDSLTWLRGFRGTLDFNTLGAHQAIAAAGGVAVSGVLEIKFTVSGSEEQLALHIPGTLTPDLLSAEIMSIPNWPGVSMLLALEDVVGYTGGGATNLDGIVTAGMEVGKFALFAHSTDGGRIYKLTAGTTAESSPGVIRPDDYAASTNEKVWISVL